MTKIQKLLLSLLFCAYLTEATLAQEAEVIKIQAQITDVQPMTGIVLWSDNEQLEAFSESISLEYRYCGYNEIVGPDGSYDFTKLERILDDIASRNHQAVLRFYFCYVGKETTVPEFIKSAEGYDESVGTSEGERTSFCDWSNSELQEFTLKFYSEFAKRYDDDPRIAFLQTGFGLWAEYHIYDGPRVMGKTFPSLAYQERFLTHLDQAFDNLPWSISIDSADNEYSPLEDNQELLDLEFGLFDDSFLCKPHPRENAVNWRILGSKRWQRQPGGGEFSYYNRKDQRLALSEEGPNGVSFEEAARQFHITYMIGNDQPNFQKKNRIKAASLASGYRFRVTKAVWDEDGLRLTVTNDGVAPLYRDAFFATAETRSQTSLRSLLPGQTIDCLIPGIGIEQVKQLQIDCDAILPTQSIQFEADLTLQLESSCCQ